MLSISLDKGIENFNLILINIYVVNTITNKIKLLKNKAQHERVFTTLAFVTFDETGDRSFNFARKPGADTCLQFEEEAHAQILWGLKQADFVKISDEEVEFLWNCDIKEAVRKLLEEYDVKLALITLGAKGAYLVNKEAMVFAACPKVSPIDTTGAGDICGGSAVSRLLQLGKVPEALSEQELIQMVTFAVTAASLSTECSGGIPSIPKETEVYKVNPAFWELFLHSKRSS